MMKLYLAIVASLLTPAHGAAVDVLDTPKNRRALREDWKIQQCRVCLNSLTLETCKVFYPYANCEALDKDAAADSAWEVTCDNCIDPFKSADGCKIMMKDCTKITNEGTPYINCGTSSNYGGDLYNKYASNNLLGCLACGPTVYEACEEEKANDPAPSSSPTPSGGGGGGGSGGDDPCFSRDTYACRLLDPKAPASEAYAQCFLGAAGDAATRALMSELAAGDTVLSDADTAARVVVNQHKVEDGKASLLITLTHARGSLALTPDHVLELDGKFMPAREAHVGAALSNGAVIEAISHSRGGIINPITVTGKILAAAATGEPVVAATGNEWLADVMLSAYPKYTLSYTLAAAFPAAVQAYYDGALEPLFTAAVPHLTKIKAAAPAPLVGVLLVAGDAALATGFAAYSLGLKGVATLAVIAVAAARKGKKP